MTGQALPSVPPRSRSRHVNGRSLRSYRIVFIAINVALGLVTVEYAWLRGRQHARAVAQANERVAGRIDIARAHMAAGDWAEAIRHLEDARDTQRASNRDEVLPVLDQAQRGQADALLEAAKLAIAHKDAVNALHLLQAYAAHPRGADLASAQFLREDLERATSSEAAAEVLASLSDDVLTVFARQGQLTRDDGLRSDGRGRSSRTRCAGTWRGSSTGARPRAKSSGWRSSGAPGTRAAPSRSPQHADIPRSVHVHRAEAGGVPRAARTRAAPGDGIGAAF